MIEYVYLAMLAEKSFVGETTNGINIVGNIKENSSGKFTLKFVAGFNSPMELRSGFTGDGKFSECDLDFKDLNRKGIMQVVKEQMNKLFEENK